jgi:hypothetical protein
MISIVVLISALGQESKKNKKRNKDVTPKEKFVFAPKIGTKS